MANPEKLCGQTKEVLGHVAEIFGEPDPVPEDRIIAVADGVTLNVGNNVNLKVVETLGHASYNLSFYESLHDGIFSGDAAGIYVHEFDLVVPTTPAPFRHDIALASLDRLVRFNPKALYFSYFGVASDAVKRPQDHAL